MKGKSIQEASEHTKEELATPHDVTSQKQKINTQTH